MSEVIRKWSENAAPWREHSATIRTMFTPLTKSLIQETGITTGQSVLDVAGGAGEPSLTIAEIVGPRGHVTCTDAVPEMVQAAREEASQRGLTNVTFRQCVADTLPFENDSFDATVCRLGVMFFPDVPRALREMLRVTKPHGRIGFAVWGKDERNPFTHIPTEVVSRYAEMPPEEGPDAPTAFRFAEPGKLATLLAEAGATDVRERVLNFHIEAPISREQFWRMRSATSGTLREKLETLSDKQRQQIEADIFEAVREFFPNEQMRIPAEMLVVSAQKP
jgi:ubiquinone/menaquinone biosynthesis C-methylase UbiE